MCYYLDIGNVLTFAEESVLQSDLPLPINLQRLDEISTRVTSRTQIQGTDVTKLVNMLQDAKEQRQPTSCLWFTCVVVISVVIGSLWPIWLRLAKHCYVSLRKNVTTPQLNPLPKASLIQSGNENGTELQVTRSDQQMEQNEATLTTPKGEDPKTFALLTAFVQHGVLTNDQL